MVEVGLRKLNSEAEAAKKRSVSREPAKIEGVQIHIVDSQTY